MLKYVNKCIKYINKLILTNRYAETVFSNIACYNASFLRSDGSHYGCFQKNHGLDLDLASETFAQISRIENPTICESVCTNNCLDYLIIIFNRFKKKILRSTTIDFKFLILVTSMYMLRTLAKSVIYASRLGSVTGVFVVAFVPRVFTTQIL